MEAVRWEPVVPEQLTTTVPGDQALFAVEWVSLPELPEVSEAEEGDDGLVLMHPSADEGTTASLPAGVRAVTHQVLERLQSWAADDRNRRLAARGGDPGRRLGRR